MSLVDINKYYENKDKLMITICDDCQGEFMIVQESLRVEDLIIKGERLAITYFTCPHCNKLYQITLDSVTTLQLKTSCEMYVNKVKRLRSKGQEPSEKLISRVDKQKKLLNREYSRLDNTYKGVFYQRDVKETGIQGDH